MASNSLSPERRAKLLDAIQKMEAAGESQDYIQGVVDHYKAKYAGAPSPAPGPPKLAGGYFEGPSHYKENFGGDPLNYIRVGPIGMSVPLGRGIDAFPSMGGAVGGVVGGVPGAGIYGGALETLRRSLRGMPLEPGPIAMEGGKQALLQGAGAALGAGSLLVGPAARLAERAAANPIARGVAKLLPFGGYAGRGLTGAAVGAALPIAGKAAIKVATDPRTEAFLGSMAFRSFARHFPQAANQIVRQLTAPQE